MEYEVDAVDADQINDNEMEESIICDNSDHNYDGEAEDEADDDNNNYALDLRSSVKRSNDNLFKNEVLFNN